MNSRRWLAALFAAGILGLTASPSDAWWRRGPTVGGSTWGSYYPSAGYPYYQAYVMPLPAYGVLPPPLATYNMLYGSRGMDEYYRALESTDLPPRFRPNLYPAVPYEKQKPPEPRVDDKRRARFEITVPYENAVVYFDGAKTTQTGLRRVYVTPPLVDDQQYVMSIRIEFMDKGGDRRIRERSFTVVAGQAVTHTFVE